VATKSFDRETILRGNIVADNHVYFFQS